MPDPAVEPLKPPEAKQLVRSIVENGTVEFSGHAIAEMEKDELDTTDCLNLLRAGVYNPPELTNGEWRYREKHNASALCLHSRPKRGCGS